MPYRTVTYSTYSSGRTRTYTTSVYYTDLTTVFTPCYSTMKTSHTSGCTPFNFLWNVEYHEIYSPGICPEGYTVGCEAWTTYFTVGDDYFTHMTAYPWLVPEADETVMKCVPRFVCDLSCSSWR